MKAAFVLAASSVGLFALSARAQTSTPPVSPAPPVPAAFVAASTPASPASGATIAARSQIVYASRLPSANELVDAATAQGLTIDRIDQTSAQVVAVYRYGNGQTNTVAYQLVPPAGTSLGRAVAVVPATQPPTIVYQSAPQVIYYDSYRPAYYYRPWNPPISFQFGVGYGFGRSHGHGGYYRGGHCHRGRR